MTADEARGQLYELQSELIDRLELHFDVIITKEHTIRFQSTTISKTVIPYELKIIKWLPGVPLESLVECKVKGILYPIVRTVQDFCDTVLVKWIEILKAAEMAEAKVKQASMSKRAKI